MKHRFNVVITDFVDDALEPERRVLDDLAEVRSLNALHEEELIGRVENADAIMVYHSLTLSGRTLERLNHCRLIVRCGVGYDNVDWAFARQQGIPVVNVPDYGTEEVADSAIGMTLALTRGIANLNSCLRAGQNPWSHAHVAPLQRLRGQVFAIVGLGRIGTATALRAKAFGFSVVFYDPYKPDGYDKALGIRQAKSLAELLEQAYVLSLHCPLSSETHHLINRETLGKMQRGSYLINTARGAVIDTDAIPDAITSGQLAGAGIDVLAKEPPGADDCLIAAWRNPNHPAHNRVVINPHAAFYSEQGITEMRIKGAEACRRALLGTPIGNVVNDTLEVR